MKNLLLIFIFIFVIFCTEAKAVTYSEAITKSKPCAVIIYADWADDLESVMSVFDSMEQVYGKKYNFVKLDIASSETKKFNKTYYIYPNLPYIMLFKEKGKTSRFLTKDCINDSACIKDRFDFFAK